MTGFLDDSGNYLDYSGEDLKITKQVASFYDFKLKGNYSVDFKIPNTAKNRDTLGYYGAQQITSPAFSQQSFNLVYNGNTLIKGYLIIKGSDEALIDCFFVSGNSNWFDLLQFNVRDILFPSRFTVSWEDFDTQKSATEGITFPIVDWCYNGQHRSQAFNVMNYFNVVSPFDAIQEAFPCLYMSTLVKEMGNHGGVNIAGDLLTDPIFNRMIITPEGPDMTISQALIDRTICQVQMSTYEFPAASYPLFFDTIVRKGDLASFNTSTGLYTCPIKGEYKIVIKFGVYSTNVDSIGIEQRRGGSVVTFVGQWIVSSILNGSAVINIACNAGDTLILGKTGTGLLAAGTTVTYSLEENIKPYYIRNYAAGIYAQSVGYILPNAIAPSLTGVELIKALCVMFGAYCTYDETSKTLSINKISKLKREDAKDWSKHYVSHYDNYQTGAATNNFIKYADTEEPGIIQYNQLNVAGFGGWDIRTSFDAVAYRDVYKIPFAGSYDEAPDNMLGWFMPYIKFYDLQDDTSKTWDFTTVSNSGGFANFNSAAGDQTFKIGELVRITGTFYSGYGIVSSATTTDLQIKALPYLSSDTGKLSKVTYSPVQGANRILLAYPGTSLAYSGGSTVYFYYGDILGSVVSSSTGCLAWFDKPKMGLTIDSLTDSLAMDTVMNRTYNLTMSEKYHQYIENIYNNPTVKAKLRLPASAFQSFDFKSFVYLKTEKLTGYFFVSKIEWKDPQTECNVELLYLD